MRRADTFIGLDAFALRMAVIGYSAVIAAVMLLLFVVTPADRGGGPILADMVRPVFQQLGLSFGPSPLAGENTFANTRTVVAIKPRFIVRFDESSPLQKSIRIFRENRAKGRMVFEETARDIEGFSAFSLAAVTPAGEAVLVYQKELKGGGAEQVVFDIAESLRASDEIVLVDPYSIYPVARSGNS